MIESRGVRPAEVVVKGMGSNVAKDCPSVPSARRRRTPDVIDQFMIVEGEEAGHMPVLLGKGNPPAQIKFVIFPYAHHGGHQVDRGGESIYASP